jgi:hypothetical protein
MFGDECCGKRASSVYTFDSSIFCWCIHICIVCVLKPEEDDRGLYDLEINARNQNSSSRGGGRRRGPTLYEAHAMDEAEDEEDEQSQAQLLFRSLHAPTRGASDSRGAAVPRATANNSAGVPGFSASKKMVLPPKNFPGPKVPADFQPVHRFATPTHQPTASASHHGSSSSSSSSVHTSGMELSQRVQHITMAHGGYRPAVELPLVHLLATPAMHPDRIKALHAGSSSTPSSGNPTQDSFGYCTGV